MKRLGTIAVWVLLWVGCSTHEIKNPCVEAAGAGTPDSWTWTGPDPRLGPAVFAGVDASGTWRVSVETRGEGLSIEPTCLIIDGSPVDSEFWSVRAVVEYELAGGAVVGSSDQDVFFLAPHALDFNTGVRIEEQDHTLPTPASLPSGWLADGLQLSFSGSLDGTEAGVVVAHLGTRPGSSSSGWVEPDPLFIPFR